MSEMDEIIREFLVESNEGLDELDRDLVELEKDPDCKELLASIFRAIHTIKGTSGVLGFAKLESVAHVGENLLSRMRDKLLRLSPGITTALLSMVDVLRTLLQDIERSGVEGDRDCSAVIANLSAALAAGSKSEAELSDGALLGNLLVDGGVARSAVDEALEKQKRGDQRRIGEILILNGEATAATVAEALTKQDDARCAATSGNIRVDVALLDKVMNLVGELVLARNHSMAMVRLRSSLRELRNARRESWSIPPVMASGGTESAWTRY